MTIAELHFHFLNSNGVCTDTRSLVTGQLYFALKGENFNGNTFAQQALDQGAAIAIIDENNFQADRTVLVDDVLTTLQQLATYHRNYLNVPIIGLTGSNGKTTTKELINAVLSQHFKTTATAGNLNNHIGVPLTLLSMDADTEIGIIEMGANHQGEIKMLSAIAQPNYGYITNFGKAHLEGFGGIEGVIKGKSELYDYLRNSQGTVFINDNDKIQLEKSKDITNITFGSDSSDIPVILKNTTPTLTVACGTTTFDSHLIGAYNFSNIAAAIAIGTHFKIAPEQIKSGIDNYTPENNRSQIIKRATYQVILDAYNANPTSMKAALENLNLHRNGPTIAFIGNMFEVGSTAKEEHQDILNLAASLGIDQVYAIGPDFGQSVPQKNQEVYGEYHAFAKAFSLILPEGATVLIKGSRGMKMERVLELLN